MKYKLFFDKSSCKNFFVLKYEDGEWEQVRKKLEEIGLREHESRNLWGKEISGRFYKETNEELKKMIEACEYYNIGRNVYYIDDVNSAFYYNGRVNIAIFRVVPVNGEVRAEVDNFLTINDFRKIIIGLKSVFQMLFNIVTEKEVEIKIVKKEEKYVSDSDM
jgi:hypothetical protein